MQKVMSETIQKKWTVRTIDKSKEISFLPTFVVKALPDQQISLATDKEVECTVVDIELKDDKGKTISMRMGFQELFMFVYYCANEELRQQLQLRYERQISHIPYELTFKLDAEEIQKGMAKRLVKLPVDEITMAMVRSEAQMLAGKVDTRTIEQWFADKRMSKKKVTS